MSGIVGLYQLSGGTTSPAAVHRMLGTMPHRSPDGVGVWSDDAVGLGHGMLETTPESLHETQPFSSRAETLTITADARIDNRRELTARLGLPRSGRIVTDSEIILAAYEKWGEACVDHLIGDFAFAVWDAERQHLFCAKDHLGVNSLFFWHQPGELFACASEIKALTVLPDIQEEIDAAAVAAYMTRQLLDQEKTAFKGILRLLPGHTLTVSPEGLKTRKYWEAKPSTEPVPETDEACTEKFLELFTEAVRCRLRSAHPVGTELSGGLDSSFVTCVARELLGAGSENPLPTVSLVYDLFPECDERPFIESIVAQGGIETHFSSVEEHGLLGLLENILEFLDDGRTGGNHHLNWLTSAAAKKAGLRILLTGQDGDTTVFHGWQYFSELAAAERWEEFAVEARLAAAHLREEKGAYNMQEGLYDPRQFVSGYAMPVLKQWATEGRLLKLGRGIEAIARHFSVPRRKLYRWFWRDAVLPPRQAKARQVRAKVAAARREVPPIVDPDLAQNARLAERLVQHKLAAPSPLTVRDTQRRMLQSPYLTFSLEKLTLYAAANGVEARHPFMDKRLVEYCLSLPPEQSFSRGWSRIIMRRAMEGIVPPEVQWRVGKTHLGPPYRHVFLERSREKITELASQLETVASGYLNVPYITSLMERIDDLSHEEMLDLSSSMTIATWLRKKGRRRNSITTREADRVAGDCSSEAPAGSVGVQSGGVAGHP